MQTSALRVLYRALWRAQSDYEREMRRVAASSVSWLVRVREWELLQRALPELPSVAWGGKAWHQFDNGRQALQYAFRGGGSAAQRWPQERRVELGFAALRHFNERVGALSRLVYQPHSSTVTEGVQVEVYSTFVGREEGGGRWRRPADDGRGAYLFAYMVRLQNLGTEPVTLLRRHWDIADLYGAQETVQGPGVVGQTPTLDAGDVYEYQSGCPLAAPLGVMRGSYHMVRTHSAQEFEAEIKPFGLMVPLTETAANSGGRQRANVDRYPWEEDGDGATPSEEASRGNTDGSEDGAKRPPTSGPEL